MNEIKGGLLSPDDRGLTFEQMHNKYSTRIYTLTLGVVHDPEKAADLTVETFVDAYRAWDWFRDGAPVFPWLYQIAINNGKRQL